MDTVADILSCAAHPRPTALTVGSFDGVHLGHRRLLETLVRAADARGLVPAVMTLDPHPRQLFAPGSAPNILTTAAQKNRLLAASGVGAHFTLPFTRETAAMDREAFVRDVVVRQCGARLLLVGHDFRFGRDAAGSFEYLREHAGTFGLEVARVDALILDGECVSSTLIRERVLQGAVEDAARCLGRPYALEGPVLAGRGIGRTLGFPTANLAPGNLAVPAHGVYIAETLVDGHTWPSAVNIGIAPTVRNEDALVETHLLGFTGDLIGKTVEIIFHRRLRPEQRFSSLEDLKAAIRRDLDTVHAHFSS